MDTIQDTQTEAYAETTQPVTKIVTPTKIVIFEKGERLELECVKMYECGEVVYVEAAK